MTVAGGRDPTRPEYVVSDMLRPLPELDLNFVSFDAAREAVGPVHCPSTSSVSVSRQSDGTSRPSYTAVIHGQEGGDAAGYVISSDESFSSGSENSPGGFRKRHNVSPPFRRRVDKKLLQIQKGRGRGGVGRGILSNTIPASPPSRDSTDDDWDVPFNTVRTRPVSGGRGILRGGPLTDRPEFSQFAVQSGRRPERQNAAASWDDFRDNAGRHRRRRGLLRMRFDQLDCFMTYFVF